MASTILSSARHGAYIAIGLYVAMVLVVSLGAQYQGSAETSLQAARPSVHYGPPVARAALEHGAAKGAVGA
ncbi:MULTISPECIES: hypothetical protein [unclassified Pseudomonas]|jgi:hypothetical protein|uniref:hypothetical protein n=1 Tax=Pseudomonas TaxID=286 RepID=UPI0014071D13|nr:hypothetical protein [Pseudomonas sp. PICF6]MXR30111.1 hypothetical protein [Pseudomonas sp. PICF6]